MDFGQQQLNSHKLFRHSADFRWAKCPAGRPTLIDTFSA